MKGTKLIGPFKQLLTMAHLPLEGALPDDSLTIVSDAGLLIENDRIQSIGTFESLFHDNQIAAIEEISSPMVCLPGFIDCHTHICFAGSRARDYAMRNAGKSYLEIAKAGGGILESVRKTRAASQAYLAAGLAHRAHRHLTEGVTTCEVKSGYALNVDGELKMLRSICKVNDEYPTDFVSTCLAAHTLPTDFAGTPSEYLQHISTALLPEIRKLGLTNRVDIFVEESAFTVDEARAYLQTAKQMGFSVTMHVDQFTAGSSLLAVALEAVSADHLEASTEKEIAALAASNVVCVVLPGASLGLGCAFAPARNLLDKGACLAIATDWNPGSAPMGDLLMQAAVLAASEKLTTVETFAAITFRAAAALELRDRGKLQENMLADFVAFPCDDYREILYHQGKLKPASVWKNGDAMR